MFVWSICFVQLRFCQIYIYQGTLEICCYGADKRSNQLHHGKVVIVKYICILVKLYSHTLLYIVSKKFNQNRNIIHFRFHFIFYWVLSFEHPSVLLFCSLLRFECHQRLFHNKYIRWSSTRSRMYVVAYCIVSAMRNESPVVNKKNILMVYYITTHDPRIYLI